MKSVKRIVRWILYFLLVPVLYMIISLILSSITIDRINKNQVFENTIYLNTNGVHLDIILPKSDVDSLLLSGLKQEQSDRYLSFGWGDENFYIHTPTWKDLTFKNAFTAMFLKSSTLMHVTRYRRKRSDWIEIKISDAELAKLTSYLLNSFETDENGKKIILKNQGYSTIDDFYKATGSYSCLKTCNTWVNSAFKQSGLKSCLWTPFDFTLMKKHE
ncbi:MAG: TIGR02117 family protein [Bacteroidota bacterium]